MSLAHQFPAEVCPLSSLKGLRLGDAHPPRPLGPLRRHHLPPLWLPWVQ